ncbi:MAG TPA: FkbM family methyltransferase [Saccharospirillum sp.]|nr:FkbM family methyltransferase [Saccharospirillum sp.]
MTDLLNLLEPVRQRHIRTASFDKNPHRPPSGYVRSEYGILLRRNWLDATFHFCKKGSYDLHFADFLRHQADPFVFVDIGANQGLYSILAGLNANCEQAIAFEPVSSTFSLLKANIAINGVEAVVHPVQAAVSLSTGHATIAKKPGHSGAASLRQLPRWFRVTETISTLGPEALPALVPANTGRIIKIDVEGHEKSVLEALGHSGLLENTMAVFYEVNPQWSQEGELESILRQHGFTTFNRTSAKQCHDVLATR